MSNQHDLELVSAAADGGLERDEQAELEKLLAESPEARRFKAYLDRLETLLSRVPEPEFPRDLHRRIMERLPQPQPTVVRPARFARPSFGSVMRYGLAAAIGGMLMLAVLEMQPLTPVPMQYQELVGTVAPGIRPAATLLDRYPVRADGLSGAIQLRDGGDLLFLDVQVESGEPVDLVVEFPHAVLQPTALRQDGQPLGSLELTDRLVRTRISGQRHMILSFRRIPDTGAQEGIRIGIEFSRNGTVVQRGSLSSAS